MEEFVIEGGVPLRGEITPSGNKNAALPLLAACLLTAEPVVLHNIPQIRDVLAMRELIESVAVAVEDLLRTATGLTGGGSGVVEFVSETGREFANRGELLGLAGGACELANTVGDDSHEAGDELGDLLVHSREVVFMEGENTGKSCSTRRDRKLLHSRER